MSDISVSIVRADTNQAFDVQLPDDVNVSELVVEIVKEMGLPRLSPDGDLVAYELSNKRTGDWVRDGTLAAKGVKSGDCFLLTSSFVAGSEHEIDEAFNASILSLFREHGMFLYWNSYASCFTVGMIAEVGYFTDDGVRGATLWRKGSLPSHAEKIRAASARLHELEGVPEDLMSPVVHKGVNSLATRGEDFRVSCVSSDYDRSNGDVRSLQAALSTVENMPDFDGMSGVNGKAELARVLEHAITIAKTVPGFVSADTPGAWSVPFDESFRSWDWSEVTCRKCAVHELYVTLDLQGPPVERDGRKFTNYGTTQQQLERWRVLPAEERDLSNYGRVKRVDLPPKAAQFRDALRERFHGAEKILAHDNYFQKFVVMMWTESRDLDLASAGCSAGCRLTP